MTSNVHPTFRGFTAAPARHAAQRHFRGFLTLADTQLDPAARATTACDVPGCHAPDHRVRAAG